MAPAPKLPATSHAVLGILSIHAMSGYELAQAAERSIANFWPVSRSQIYTELARLEELGLVEGTEVAQDNAPDKRVFELTAAGLRAFEEWISTPGYEPWRLRVGFCLKTFFGHHMPRDVMVENLRSFKKESEQREAYLASVVEMLAILPHAAFSRATAELGRRMSEAAARWAQELLDDVPDIPNPSDEEQEKIHEIARELFRRVPEKVD